MGLLKIFLIFIIFIVSTGATTISRCPENEVFKFRWRPERNCAVDAPRTVRRTKVCTCLPGLVRNGTGSCIPRDECPICEDPNSFFSYCAEEIYPNCITYPCPPICISGCKCKDGHIKENGYCVPEGYCTGPNEVYTSCMPNNCPPGMACHQMCMPGCVCINGFERNKSGICVKKPSTTPRP